jgi:hypothetical protein
MKVEHSDTPVPSHSTHEAQKPLLLWYQQKLKPLIVQCQQKLNPLNIWYQQKLKQIQHCKQEIFTFWQSSIMTTTAGLHECDKTPTKQNCSK